jgi:hypothetical protein
MIPAFVKISDLDMRKPDVMEDGYSCIGLYMPYLIPSNSDSHGSMLGTSMYRNLKPGVRPIQHSDDKLSVSFCLSSS